MGVFPTLGFSRLTGIWANPSLLCRAPLPQPFLNQGHVSVPDAPGGSVRQRLNEPRCRNLSAPPVVPRFALPNEHHGTQPPARARPPRALRQTDDSSIELLRPCGAPAFRIPKLRNLAECVCTPRAG